MPQRPKEPRAQDVRKLDSGRWQARVTYYDAETGKRHETSQTFSTEREAKKWGREQEITLRHDPTRKPPSHQTLAEFIPEWLRTMEAQGLAAKTIRGYRQMAAHALAAFGHKALKNVTTWEIQQLYTAMAETHSSRTINYVHTTLHRALNDAVDWGLIAANPAAKAKAPRGQRRPITILTPEDTQRFLAAARESRWYPLWALMLHTELRPGEAIAVRWQDIHWETRSLHVRQAVSGDGRQRVLGPTKTDRSTRPVALGPTMVALLQTWQQEQAQERAAAGERWQDQDLVFCTHEGRLLSPRNVAREFHKVRERAGLPAAIHPHCLRHAMASHWLAAGQSIKVVSERLGHTSIAFTLQVYAHLLPNQQEDAATAMDRQLFVEAIHTTSTRAFETSKLG